MTVTVSFNDDRDQIYTVSHKFILDKDIKHAGSKLSWPVPILLGNTVSRQLVSYEVKIETQQITREPFYATEE